MFRLKNIKLQNIHPEKYYNSTLLSNLKMNCGIKANVEVELKYTVCDEKLYSLSMEKINHLLFNMPSEVNYYLGAIMRQKSPLTLKFMDISDAKKVLNNGIMSEYGINIIDMKLKTTRFYIF